jgi:hypothetical protein
MRGPIDYIIVGFEGNKFDGSIMSALTDAVDKGIISVLALSIISKDAGGNVTKIDMSDFDDAADSDPVDQADVDEVADLINNNCTAGLLVVEQLWAKPLKSALIKANGVLLAEGRIHPEAALELERN